MKKEKQEEISKEERKKLKLEEKEHKKSMKLKLKEEKKAMKLKKKQPKIKVKKEKKKIDKFKIFSKIIAAILVAFTLIGTCYTFIYLVINA